MSNTARTFTLGEHFAMVEIAGALEKSSDGGYEILGSTVMNVCMMVYQKGAILGMVKGDNNDRIAALTSLIVAQEGKEQEVWNGFRELAKKALDDYGKEPDNFTDFVKKTVWPEVEFGNWRVLKQLYNEKARLGDVLLMRFQFDTARGIGFGALYPELVKKMWFNAYEKEWDKQVLAEAREHGVNLPKQDPLPLAEIEQIVLQEVAEFIKQYHPNLIKPLGL